jgi:parallel beta helix pectate lyase-like protein
MDGMLEGGPAGVDGIRPQPWRRRLAGLTALAAAAVALSGSAAPPAGAVERQPTAAEQRCLQQLVLRSFTGSVTSLDYGQTSTLTWDVQVPAGCGIDFELPHVVPGVPEGRVETLGRAGTRTFAPVASGTSTLRARIPGTRATRKLGGVWIEVVFPPGDFTITRNSEAPALRQLVGEKGRIVRVANNVSLDLTGQSFIGIAEGVILLGGRDAHTDGPLLFTRGQARVLLRVVGDGVRIYGLRIRGENTGVASSGNTSGIQSNSNQRLEIDHNEISGWRHAAVELRDPQNRVNHLGTPMVRVHDNFIHHNQREGADGYGVAVYESSYAQIERNVFDYNRHAVTGADGSRGSGYRAYDNLVGPHGGNHRKYLGKWFYTHQFDMHGQKHCGPEGLVSDSVYNCGPAGHSMDIRYNSFLYINGTAIKLRGTPQVKPCGMVVSNNVFRHVANAKVGAIVQTRSGACASSNQFNVNSLSSMLKCDIDGNGTVDAFLATGQTWWYASGIRRHFTFLRRSKERPKECPPPLPPPTSPRPPRPPTATPTPS